MRSFVLILSALGLLSCYLPPTMQPTNNNNYNNTQPQPDGQPEGYPDGGQPTNGNGGNYGISSPNLGPNATYTCEATCNGAKATISCQGVDNCNAWCDDYNAPHAECKQ